MEMVQDHNTETGEITMRPQNVDEIAQAKIDAADEVIYKANQIAADQALSDARTSGIAHALSLGFTQAQAEAMFP